MKLKDYLSGKTVSLCTAGISGLFLFLAFHFCNVPLPFTVCLLLGESLIIVVGIVMGWRQASSRLQKLKKQLEILPDKYLIGELLERPKDAVELEYFLLIKEISRSAIGAVEQVREQKKDYCDYVTQWVHEMKTPLTACSLILSNDGDVYKLKRELRRADNLTETILSYAKLWTAEKEIQIHAVDLRNLCDRAITEEIELLMAAKIRLFIEGDGKVYTDSKLLIFILKQLLINCAKYCQGCTIRIELSEGKICFEDNGPGIPSHELHRVTERGFSGCAGRKEGQSTGMGLYIVSRICQKLNIHMDIFSQEGEFTLFCFVFSI